MNCKNCNQPMKLRSYSDELYNYYIYECDACGIITKPKPNCDYEELKRERKNKVIQDLKEFNLVVDTEVINFLTGHPNPFPLIVLLSKTGNLIYSKQNFKKFLRVGGALDGFRT